MSFSIILSFLMAVVYAGLGIFLLVADSTFIFSSFQRVGFGLILLFYGVFRFYRTLKKNRESALDEDEE